MKAIHEMRGGGYSIGDIAGELDLARNTVHLYLKDAVFEVSGNGYAQAATATGIQAESLMSLC